MAFVMLSMIGCSEKEECVIKNLSGVDWYNTTVWLMEGEDKNDFAEMDMEKVGDIPVGGSFTVETDRNYFYITAYDRRGHLIESEVKMLYFSLGSDVKEYDLVD